MWGGRRWEGGKEVRGGDDDARRSCSSGPQAGCRGCILGVQFPVFALCLLLLLWSCANLYARSIFFGGAYRQQGDTCIKGDSFMDTLRFNLKIETVT